MKKAVIILLLTIFALNLSAQKSTREFAQMYAQTAGEQTVINPSEWFDGIVHKLDKKSQKNPELFLKNLFYSVQNKHLKHYKSYASFGDLIERGAYDCLTGTTLYALLLTHYEIPYEIHETPFHINLTATVGGNTYLLESTDPFTGFQLVTASYVSSEIGLKELAGLLYYNRAVDLNNEQDFQSAFIAAAHAQMIYPSERTNTERQIIERNLISSVVSAIEDQ